MTRELMIESLLETVLQRFAALGIPRESGDVEAYARYRQGLTSAERAQFDNLITRGTFPGAAAETVEISAGRQKPQEA